MAEHTDPTPAPFVEPVVQETVTLEHPEHIDAYLQVKQHVEEFGYELAGAFQWFARQEGRVVDTPSGWRRRIAEFAQRPTN